MSQRPPVELLDPSVIEEQKTFLERVGDAFGTDDDFLKALLANQLQLAQLQRQSIDTFEGMAAAFRDGIQQAYGGNLVSFPADGTRFSFARGTGVGNRHVIDLKRGIVDANQIGEFEMSQSLDDYGAEIARSAQIWADDDIKVRTLVDDEITGVWEFDQCVYLPLDAIRADEVTLDASRPLNFRAQFSTGVVAPLTPAAVASHQSRWGHITTSDGTGLQTVPFAGSSAGDYQEQTRNAAADNWGRANIHASNIGQHHFIVQNVAGNDAEVQARVFDFGGGAQQAADNDIHGSVDTAATNVITVPANDFVFLESDINAHVYRLLAQAATDGNEVELEVQYRGLSPSIR